MANSVVDAFTKGVSLGELMRQRKREEELNRILQGAYQEPIAGRPAQTFTTPAFGDEDARMYDPGTPVELPGTPGRPGGFDFQNALAGLYKGGFGREALSLQQTQESNELAKLLRQAQLAKAIRPNLSEPKAGMIDGKEIFFRTDDAGNVFDLSGQPINQPIQPRPQQPLVENYGAPVAGVDEQGNPVYFQPGKRGGAPSIVPGIKPPKEPESQRNQAAALRRLESARRKADIVTAKIEEALSKTGFWTTGIPGTVLGMIPSTGAYNLDRTIDTIKANIGFQELQAMREASPTGGALGQVAVKELDFLQASIASLEKGQDPEVLKANLEAVRTHFQNWKNAVEQSYQEQYKELPPPQAGPSASPTGQPPAALQPGKTIEDGYIYLGGDPAKPESWKKLR